MRTPRYLLLAVLLTSFALLGAECGNNEPDEDPLPKRAGAATPFLRTYYQAQTFPKNMRAIKIPEGPEFEDDELTVKFGMGGNELVTDIDVGLTVTGDRDPTAYDLYARLISPQGTVSAYKPVDIATGALIYKKVHIPFAYEFDNENSSGTWKLQLRDPIQDDDGRLRFRNATLRINDGESSTIRGLADNANESVTLTAAEARYDVLREVDGGLFPFDFGKFGTNAMLMNTFTFTQSFSVRSAGIQFAIKSRDSSVPAENLMVMIMSPSGNYSYGAAGSSSLEIEVGSVTYSTYTLQLPDDLNGEPSLGTWTLALVDTKLDSNTMELSNIGVIVIMVPDGMGGFTATNVLGTIDVAMSLSGRTYT